MTSGLETTINLPRHFIKIGDFRVAKDLRGSKFAKLTFIYPERKQGHGRAVVWKCKCDCGNYFESTSHPITSGHTKSCGCTRKEKLSALSILPSGNSTKNALYRRYRYVAIKADREFELSEQEFYELVSKDCFYCGESPKPRKLHAYFNGEFVCNGIDRLDSSRGYSVENCVPCCPTCNRAKNDTHVDDFISWISKTHDHLTKTGHIK